MRKIIVLLVISFWAISLQAQECDSLARHIVGNIKNYSPDDLLPYYDKELKEWGLMSKRGKILTLPIADYPNDITFSPNFNLRLWNKWCEISINGSDYSYKTDNPEDIVGVAADPKNSNLTGFKTYTNSNQIREYSSHYNQIGYQTFLHNEKRHTTAQLVETKKYGIIDQDGNTLSNFDFKYKSLSLVLNYKDTTQLWFYFEDEEGKRGFVNIEGKTKLYGQLLSSVDTYYTHSVQKSEEKFGIIDLRTLKWAIKPQKKFTIENRIIEIGQNNENFTYYAVVSNGDEKFLIDMRKKVYKPKNKGQ
ncbi:MAG: hypothetical protein LBR55_02550 [Bacteroidales bacterium]|jgi:hypothetical protein|nr:hypothetical protein [Bacteroidales bacterium]